MEYGKRILELLAMDAAQENLGVYPAGVGGAGGYDKRTERMEGFNEAGSKLLRLNYQAHSWLSAVPDEQQDALIRMMLDEQVELMLRGEESYLYVNCSDLFWWATADLELITLEELPDLCQAYVDAPRCGGSLWAARKRKMRPQRPCYKSYTPEESALFDACGPERDPKDEG